MTSDADLARINGDRRNSFSTLRRAKTLTASVGTLPIAALLFAPASVLDSMSRNLGQTTLADVVPTLAGTMAFALFVWLLAVAARRRADAAAALIACIWTVGALYHRDIFGSLNADLGGGYSMLHSLPIAIGAMALLSVAAWLWNRYLAPLHTVLSVIALVMVLTPAWRAAAYEWAYGDADLAYDPDRAAADLPPPAPAAGDQPPDIYHFIFDRYGAEQILSRHYGIKDHINGFLAERGFYVARDSYSNYQKTGHSLASGFAMDYLTPLQEDPRVEGSNWHPIFSMLDDHRVGRFLRARGYEHHQYGSWWVGTFDNPTAEVNRPMGFGEFNMIYLRRTMLLPIFHFLPNTPLTMRLDWDNAQCQRVARQVEEIKAIGERDRPVYVFAHILVPHGPYVFEPDGSCLDQRQARDRGPEQGYVEQIGYANTIIRDVVTALQDEDRTPPVIIIQADEGPFPERDDRVPWPEAAAEELRIKTGILNGYYFPSGDYSRLRQDMTPVNGYRAVFNTIFGTGFPELPDRIYAFPNGDIYDFHDVTTRIRCEDLPQVLLKRPKSPHC